MEGITDRLRELAARAGLAGVPEPVLFVVAAGCVILCAFAALRAWQASTAPAASPLTVESPRSRSGADATATASSTPSGTAVAVIHIVGAVRRPGVYRLPSSARAADALTAAGGPLADADTSGVNLARHVTDGEQLVVPVKGAAGAAAAPAGEAGSGAGASGPVVAGGKIDLNTADEAALDALPGVGPSTAKRIVQERETNGPFSSVEDLMRVPGIGPKKFDALKDLVSAGP